MKTILRAFSLLLAIFGFSFIVWSAATSESQTTNVETVPILTPIASSIPTIDTTHFGGTKAMVPSDRVWESIVESRIQTMATTPEATK